MNVVCPPSTTYMNIRFSVFTVLLSFPFVIQCTSSLRKLSLPLVGPESLAFNSFGRGPYATVSDGRILKYSGPHIGFVDFSITSQNRTSSICDGTSNTSTLEPTCGRPLGLGFYHLTGEVFVVDAFYGLLVVGPNGGLATQLATGAHGIPFGFPDALDVDQLTGTIYFTVKLSS